MLHFAYAFTTFPLRFYYVLTTADYLSATLFLLANSAISLLADAYSYAANVVPIVVDRQRCLFKNYDVRVDVGGDAKIGGKLADSSTFSFLCIWDVNICGIDYIACSKNVT